MRKRFIDLKIGGEFKFLEKLENIPENQVFIRRAHSIFAFKTTGQKFIITNVLMEVESLESEPDCFANFQSKEMHYCPDCESKCFCVEGQNNSYYCIHCEEK
jgi:hypothetical protein